MENYYDVALSFAGEDRTYVETVADILKALKINVFYDNYEQDELWGKNLYLYLYDVYKNKAKYCVMFISKHYVKKLWTNHERKAVQDRMFMEFDKEYLLPVRLDNTEIEGISPTLGYVSNKEPAELAYLIAKKIHKDIDVKILIENLHSLLGDDYKITLNGANVSFINDIESFKAEYPLNILLEINKMGLLFEMFVGPAIVPN